METRAKRQQAICGICFDGISVQGRIDSCQHLFCFGCIETWAKRQNSCPLCKRRFIRIDEARCPRNIAKTKPIRKKTVKVMDKRQGDMEWGFDLNELAERWLDGERDTHMLNLFIELEDFDDLIDL